MIAYSDEHTYKHTHREMVPEHVDSRALQPALKIIGKSSQHPFINRSIHQSIHSLIHPSIHSFIHHSSHPILSHIHHSQTGTIERDPVLSNALLSLPLVKDSKPLSSSSSSSSGSSSSAGGGRGKGGGGGGGGKRRSSSSSSKQGKATGKFSLVEQVCR